MRRLGEHGLLVRKWFHEQKWALQMYARMPEHDGNVKPPMCVECRTCGHDGIYHWGARPQLQCNHLNAKNLFCECNEYVEGRA